MGGERTLQRQDTDDRAGPVDAGQVTSPDRRSAG